MEGGTAFWELVEDQGRWLAVQSCVLCASSWWLSRLDLSENYVDTHQCLHVQGLPMLSRSLNNRLS